MDKKSPAFGLDWTTIVSINRIWITYIRTIGKKEIESLGVEGKLVTVEGCWGPRLKGASWHRLIVHHNFFWRMCLSTYLKKNSNLMLDTYLSQIGKYWTEQTSIECHSSCNLKNVELLDQESIQMKEPSSGSNRF